MEEFERLVKLVEVLKETVEAQTQRFDQVFKTQNERWEAQEQKIDSLGTMLQQGIDQVMILDEALKKSLGESDQGLDDIADITAGLLLLKTDLEQMKQQQQGSAA